MFDRIRLPGFWIDNSTVPGSEWEQFDDNQSKAIDGDQGGAYSIQNDLIIGGAPGVFFWHTTQVIFTDVVQMQDDVEIGGSLQISDGGNFAGNYVFHDGAVTIGASGADALSVYSFAQFQDIVVHNGDAFFNNPANFAAGGDLEGNFSFHDCAVTMGASGADAFTVQAFTTFNEIVNLNGSVFFNSGGSVDFAGPVTLEAPVTLTGTGRIKQRQHFGPDADLVIGPTTATHVICMGLTADHSYKIDDAGAVDGDRMRFTSYAGSFTLTVRNPTNGLLLALKYGSGGGLRHWVDVERMTGGWLIVGTGTLP